MLYGPVNNMADLGTIVDQVVHLLKQGGFFMLVLYVMGQVGWMLALGRWWTYRDIPLPTPGWSEDARLSAAELERRLLDGVGHRGLFADLVRDLRAVRHHGETALVRKAREIVGHVGHGLNRGLGAIAALAAAAPMMGLAGTVSGVMVTFGVITVYGAGNPAMMAGGIAEALMVTEAALVIALPLILLHDRLQARADRIESEAVAAATVLIRAYTHEGAASAPAAAALEEGTP
jgi:biopolymer transport protein ExbB